MGRSLVSLGLCIYFLLLRFLVIELSFCSAPVIGWAGFYFYVIFSWKLLFIGNVCFGFSHSRKKNKTQTCYRLHHESPMNFIPNSRQIFSSLYIYFFLSFFPVFSRTKSWAMCQLNHVAWVARRLVRPIWTRCDRNVPNSRWNETLRRNCGRFIGSSSQKATVKVLRNWSESRQRSILQASRNEWDFLCCLFSFPFSLLIASWIMLQLLCLFASHT